MTNLITEIQVIPIKPKDGLIGFASVVLGGEVYLGSIGIHKKLSDDGYRITYPTKKVGEKNINIFHPVSREMGKQIELAILAKAERIFN